MATQAAHDITTDPALPLYRLDAAIYTRLVEAGALDGEKIGWRDGLLVDRRSHRDDSLYRLDTETYNRMVDTGALQDLPIELLEGLLVEMSPQGPAHASVISCLIRHLGGTPMWLGVQLPLELRPGSEPEPDLVLTEHRRSARRHPDHALLAVEVSVTSHGKDRNRKSILYARAAIPTYWLVDVPGHAVEVRTEPGSRGYERYDVYKPGGLVPSPAKGVPDLDVAWLFDEPDEA
jgi:Uma2 family endonuclease